MTQDKTELEKLFNTWSSSFPGGLHGDAYLDTGMDEAFYAGFTACESKIKELEAKLSSLQAELSALKAENERLKAKPQAQRVEAQGFVAWHPEEGIETDFFSDELKRAEYVYGKNPLYKEQGWKIRPVAVQFLDEPQEDILKELTPEEADKAYDEAPEYPLSEEFIEDIVKKVTQPPSASEMLEAKQQILEALLGEKSKRCPTCDSPKPELHPAVQYEGEVTICKNEWHKD